MPTDHAATSPLEPVLKRAALAARTERPSAPSCHAGVAREDWLVLSGDDSRTGDRGRWIASDRMSTAMGAPGEPVVVPDTSLGSATYSGW